MTLFSTARTQCGASGRELLPSQTSNSLGAQNSPANRSAWILLVCRRERASSRDWVTVKSVKLIRQLKRTSITRSSQNDILLSGRELLSNNSSKFFSRVLAAAQPTCFFLKPRSQKCYHSRRAIAIMSRSSLRDERRAIIAPRDHRVEWISVRDRRALSSNGVVSVWLAGRGPCHG